MTTTTATIIEAASLRAKFPHLTIVERTQHELEVSSRGRQQRVQITLAHGDVQCEATASWAGAKQQIRVRDGVGRVEETSPWHDEPVQWAVSFDVWVDAWLTLLAGSAAGPARPGLG